MLKLILLSQIIITFFIFTPTVLAQTHDCIDGIDNDGDGEIDAADMECLGK